MQAHDPRPFVLTDSAAIYGDFDELCEFHGEYCQMYGETNAQHQGETKLYGDSWVGAQLQLASMSRGIARLEKVIAGHPAQGAPVAPVEPEPEVFEVDEDIPF